MKIIKETAGIILKNNGKILMHLRDNKPIIPFPNCWCIIGRAREQNETPFQAITREVKEEIGVEVKDVIFVEKFLISDEILLEDYLVNLFEGKIDDEVQDIKLTEGQKVDYFSFEDLEALNTPNVLKEVIFKNKNKLIN